MAYDVANADGEVVGQIWSSRPPRVYVDPGIDCQDNPLTPSQTRQSDAESCDINRIMAKYMRDGMFDWANRFEGQFGDVSDVGTFQEATQIILKAEQMFGALSSEIRTKFDNDPGKFLNFVSDPANEDEMRSLGILNPKPVDPGPVRVEVVNAPVADAK